MRRTKLVVQGLAIAFIFMLSASSALAQVCCVSDTTSGYPYSDYWPDGSVNAWDYGALKSEWGSDCRVCRAPVQKTGQTDSYEDYDDGWYERGVGYLIERFKVCQDYPEVFVDNLTGLYWFRVVYSPAKWEWAVGWNYC